MQSRFFSVFLCGKRNGKGEGAFLVDRDGISCTFFSLRKDLQALLPSVLSIKLLLLTIHLIGKEALKSETAKLAIPAGTFDEVESSLLTFSSSSSSSSHPSPLSTSSQIFDLLRDTITVAQDISYIDTAPSPTSQSRKLHGLPSRLHSPLNLTSLHSASRFNSTLSTSTT